MFIHFHFRLVFHSTFSPGLICILDIDIQGVKSIKEPDINCNYIFVQPPSMEILKQRLQGDGDGHGHGQWPLVMHYHDGNAGRGTETEDSLQKRLTQAAADLEWVPTFNTIATIDCIKTAIIIIDITYQLILIKTIIRYGTSKGNFDIVITNNDIEDAYAEFLAFLKARYLCLSWIIANPYSQLWAEQPKNIFNQMLSPMNIASK